MEHITCQNPKLTQGKRCSQNCFTGRSNQKIKQRYLRMYTEGVKAIYGEGKYKLSEEYFHFMVPYQVWMGESEQERIAVTKKFFDELPKKQESSISPTNHKKIVINKVLLKLTTTHKFTKLYLKLRENSVADSP